MTLGVVTPFPRSENGFSENGEWGKRGANRIASPWRKVWHPFVAFSENGEWRMTITIFPPACGKNVCSIHMHIPLQGWKRWEAVKSGEFFSKNSPFFISRGEVRVPILREWTLRTWCHVTILRPWRMGGKGCDNPYFQPTMWESRGFSFGETITGQFGLCSF